MLYNKAELQYYADFFFFLNIAFQKDVYLTNEKKDTILKRNTHIFAS